MDRSPEDIIHGTRISIAHCYINARAAYCGFPVLTFDCRIEGYVSRDMELCGPDSEFLYMLEYCDKFCMRGTTLLHEDPGIPNKPLILTIEL